MAELTTQQLTDELEALKRARAEDVKKTEIMQQMLEQLLPALEVLQASAHAEKVRALLHAMELLPEFSQGKVTEQSLNDKIMSAMKIVRAVENAARG
jgi:uncharacterized protein YaaW (UPF0174 family)